MADYINLYSDYLCKNPIKQVFCGVAGLFGDYADLENGGKWSRTGSGQTPETFCYSATINGEQAEGTGGVKNAVFSGGSELFNVSFLSSPIYEDHALLTDQSSPGGGTITNAFFISSDAENRQSWCLRISAEIGYFGDANVTPITYRYNQTPYDGERQTWEYTRDAGSQWSIETPVTTQFGGIYMYSVTVGEIDYYLLLVGAGAGGTLHPTNSSFMMLIPTSYFVDQIPKPYVGPVSKDSAAEFTPTTPKRDSIASRDLTGKKNPYGFNTGNGLKLLLLSAQEQADIVKRLYTGRSGDALNALGQQLSEVIGGSGHRPADEVNTMINAILCCHIVPVITSGYAGGSTALFTISGYTLYNPAISATFVSDQIVTVTTQRTYIAPIVNNFLTYAPYCSVSLSVPFVGDIPLDTSALFTSSIYFVFYLDLYTGTLSVDVHLVDDDGRDYIYTTRQTNCAVDIPIMGTGATGNPLQKIASAAGNVASAGIVGAPAALYGIASATVDAKHTTSIGRGASSNIAPYFSQRHCYLVIEYAESANAEDFFTLNGGALEKSGTVGEFRGYTEFSAVDVSGIAGATDAEKRQIEQILKGGVYL